MRNLAGLLMIVLAVAAAAATPIGEGDAHTINRIQTAGERLYYQCLPAEGHVRAIAAVVDYVKSEPLVRDAGISDAGRSVWLVYGNGVTGGILFPVPGTRGAPKPAK